jgi:hypothetical protein
MTSPMTVLIQYRSLHSDSFHESRRVVKSSLELFDGLMRLKTRRIKWLEILVSVGRDDYRSCVSSWYIARGESYWVDLVRFDDPDYVEQVAVIAFERAVEKRRRYAVGGWN